MKKPTDLDFPRYMRGFMELVLHISYNLSFKKWYVTTDVHKKEKETKKRYIQKRFRNELGLIIDKPRQVSGNSNDGNTARRFFDNEACTADITGIDEELIRRFYVILQAVIWNTNKSSKVWRICL